MTVNRRTMLTGTALAPFVPVVATAGESEPEGDGALTTKYLRKLENGSTLEIIVKIHGSGQSRFNDTIKYHDSNVYKELNSHRGELGELTHWSTGVNRPKDEWWAV